MPFSEELAVKLQYQNQKSPPDRTGGDRSSKGACGPTATHHTGRDDYPGRYDDADNREERLVLSGILDQNPNDCTAAVRRHAVALRYRGGRARSRIRCPDP
jgi:hypothetical protein